MNTSKQNESHTFYCVIFCIYLYMETNEEYLKIDLPNYDLQPDKKYIYEFDGNKFKFYVKTKLHGGYFAVIEPHSKNGFSHVVYDEGNVERQHRTRKILNIDLSKLKKKLLDKIEEISFNLQ